MPGVPNEFSSSLFVSFGQLVELGYPFVVENTLWQPRAKLCGNNVMYQR
jgi:hypothetical protein